MIFIPFFLFPLLKLKFGVTLQALFSTLRTTITRFVHCVFFARSVQPFLSSSTRVETYCCSVLPGTNCSNICPSAVSAVAHTHCSYNRTRFCKVHCMHWTRLLRVIRVSLEAQRSIRRDHRGKYLGSNVPRKRGLIRRHRAAILSCSTISISNFDCLI